MSTPDTPAQRITAPPIGKYTLDAARSTITFRTRHMFGLGPVRGSFSLRHGDVEVTEPLESSAARAEVHAGSFATGNGARDGVVCSDKYLDTTRHPAIRFASDQLAETADGWVLQGSLEVRTVRRPVRLAIEYCEFAAREFSVRATTRIDRFDFGITAQRGMTGRYLDLTLDLVAYEHPTC